jgi:hypothetical protein
MGRIKATQSNNGSYSIMDEEFVEWETSGMMGGYQLNDDDLCARDIILGEDDLELGPAALFWILDHIDCFDRQARLNENIKELHLCFWQGFSNDNKEKMDWEKVGQAIGNLRALQTVRIFTPTYQDKPGYVHVEGDEDEEDEDGLPDWEILAHILSHVRQKIEVSITDVLAWGTRESRLFAQAIHGHPTITRFDESRGGFPNECLDTLYSALATLPALESIHLSKQQDDESTMAHPESLTELLRVPSLRSVNFKRFSFRPALCQATANALMEGTSITTLEFTMCSISTGECAAMIANGLGRNTSVSYIKIQPLDQGIFNALATSLPSNSTLRRLDLNCQHFDDGYDMDLSAVLLALGKNTTLKKLSIDGLGSILDESLCTVIKDGLEMNTTLASLELDQVHLTDENSDLWCTALSFLRTNKSLKSLSVALERDATESCAAVFRTEIAAMLGGNTSLHSLSIRSLKSVYAQEYIALITALQQNTTLKNLTLQDYSTSCPLTDDEDKQMASFLKKNYALENFQGLITCFRGDVDTILRLNEAGRRYLVEDGSSISKGVEVLSARSHDINCVFFHLLENPRLCDRSAVEIGSPEGSPANCNGKREQEQDQTLKEAKESRRRRT